MIETYIRGCRSSFFDQKAPRRGRRRLQTPRRNSLLWPASLEKAQLFGLPTLCGVLGIIYDGLVC